MPDDVFPWPARLANAAVACITYLGKAFWPVHLAVFYPYPAGRRLPSRGSVPPWRSSLWA